MNKNLDTRLGTMASYLAAALLAMTTACSTSPPTVRKISPDQQFSGFLKEYSALKPNPNMDENALTYVNTDAQKNLRGYLAIVVDPIEVFIATNADATKISESSRAAVTTYFRHALTRAVSEAYPVVDAPGPLILRLRTALVGIDVGGAVAAGDLPAESKPLAHALNIGKVGVEMELVDSVTGERVAALVDKAALGKGAEIGAERFSRVEKFAAAREAFDEWSWRVRHFLDVSMQLTGEDAARAVKSYQQYGDETDFTP
jgi:hypothetical protein